MPEVFTWLFDGIGTLLVGLALGGAGGAFTATKIIKVRSRNQIQRAGAGSTQVQAGKNVRQISK